MIASGLKVTLFLSKSDQYHVVDFRYILTDFKKATPRLKLSILCISIVMNLNALDSFIIVVYP